jgi:hypothetical protein
VEDGGYYAIKGFDFQIDKTILALFDDVSKSSFVAIEKIQDLNTDDLIVQVKYKETQEFANSKIREPVVQLIEEFIADPSRKKFVLYCHFKDRAPGSLTFDQDGIDDILKITLGKDPSGAHRKKFEAVQKIDLATRKAFAARFTLQFAEDYDSQFSKVIEVLAKQTFCRARSEAIFFYAFIADYLRKIVVGNSDISKRICNRDALVLAITDGQKMMFNLSFEEYATRENFIRFVKTRIPTLRANQKNCLIFGGGYKGTSFDLANSLSEFIELYYKNAQYDLEPPLVFLRDNILRDVKVKLIELGYIINDGFEEIKFRSDFFMRPAIVTRKLVGKVASDSLANIAFKLRIAGTSKIPEIALAWAPSRVFYFGSAEVDAWKEISAFSIQTLDAHELPHLMKIGK